MRKPARPDDDAEVVAWGGRGPREAPARPMPRAPGVPAHSYLQYSTWMWSWTSVTPGAAQAAAMASSCSAQERTTPDRVTDPGEVETDNSSASSLALRANAPPMSFLMSRPSGAVISLIRSSMPKTPGTLATMNLASSRWYCQLAVPVRVTKPQVTLASTVVGIRPSSMSAWSTSPRNSVSSRWSLSWI